MDEQRGISTETENIFFKKCQTEFMELKNNWKNLLERFNKRLDQAKKESANCKKGLRNHSITRENLRDYGTPTRRPIYI